MKTHPDDKPNFLCSRCLDCMCEDCLSIAAEYEFLAEQRKYQLVTLQNQVVLLTREVERWKSRSEAFEHVAKIGYSDVIQGYLDSLATKYRQTTTDNKEQ